MVLEVGPGAGALTALMAETASAVVAVEIDPAMARLTARGHRRHAQCPRPELDALASKHTLNPEVLDNVRAGMAVAPDRRFKLVANLPYNVATPILIEPPDPPRLRPEPDGGDDPARAGRADWPRPRRRAYGGLSVLVQALADVEIVRTLPPEVFWPRPEGRFGVVKITPNAAKRAPIADLAWFHAVVRRIFLHRRKNLRRVLYAWRGRWTQARGRRPARRRSA